MCGPLVKTFGVPESPPRSEWNPMSGRPPSRRTAVLVAGAIVAAFAHLILFLPVPARAAAGLLAACSAAFAVAMIRAVLAGRSEGPRPRALALAGGILLTAL